MCVARGLFIGARGLGTQGILGRMVIEEPTVVIAHLYLAPSQQRTEDIRMDNLGDLGTVFIGAWYLQARGILFIGTRYL